MSRKSNRKRFLRGLFRSETGDRLYHVVYRTRCREPLATNAKDRRALNKIAIDALHRFDVKLHAYCLLSNHLRALIEIDDRVLIEVLRSVANRFSRHKQFRSANELFERPYAAQRIESDGEFLSALRHIHLTPVFSNRVTVPEDYAWSSHRSYLGYRSNAMITTERALRLFSTDALSARAAYHRFIADGLNDRKRSLPCKSTIGNGSPTIRHRFDEDYADRLIAGGGLAKQVTKQMESSEGVHIELSSLDASETTSSNPAPTHLNHPYLAIY